MKGVADIRRLAAARLAKGMYGDGDGNPVPWDCAVRVGIPKNPDPQTVAAINANERELRGWTRRTGCAVEESTRMVGGIPATLIAKVTVPDETTALRLVDRATATAWRRARARVARAQAELGLDEATANAACRQADGERDVDFDVLMRTARHFLDLDLDYDHDLDHGTDTARGGKATIRTREVPIPGFGTKWLERHKGRRRFLELACAERFPELVDFPQELRFRYLDPALAGKPEQVITTPWKPEAGMDICYVVIVENKDTYQVMGPVVGGLCVWGSGFAAAGGLRLLPWLCGRGVGREDSQGGQGEGDGQGGQIDGQEGQGSVRVVYWGDMDAAGFEILSKVREQGVDCESMLMDRATYDEYAVYGTNSMPAGGKSGKDGDGGRTNGSEKEIAPQKPRATPGLRPGERALYEALCTGEGVPCRRLEQERIPIAVAMAELRRRGFPVADARD